MSIAFQTTPNNAKVTALSDAKLQLVGDPISGGNPQRPPVLVVDFQQNHPRLRVKLNNGSREQEERQIDLNVDVVVFQTLMESIIEMSNKPDVDSIAIAVKRQAYDRAAKRFSDPYVYGYVIAGKDADGCMYIGIQRGANEQSKNFIRIKFNFIEPEFHPIIDRGTMQPAPRNKVSCIIARGWASYYAKAMPIVHNSIWDYSKTEIGKWEAKKAGENGGNNNNGGYNNNRNNNYNNGNNNNYQQQSKPAPAADLGMDDDIPW